MICTVYWRKGGFILVPDCIRPTIAAEQLHGPLRHCGKLDTAMLDAELAARIERDIDEAFHASLSPELAMQLGYQAVESLRLPDGFAWREGDWWEHGSDLTLLYGIEAPVAVATIERASRGGWVSTTNRHQRWAFQGRRVCATRAAAMQYVALWAEEQAAALRAELGPRSGAPATGPSLSRRRPAARSPE